MVPGTRISLDVLVAVFASGMTAELIHDAYETVSLADLYAVLAYYPGSGAETEEGVEGIDIVRVQEVGLRDFDDPAILEGAAYEGRVLICGDIKTIPRVASSVPQRCG